MRASLGNSTKLYSSSCYSFHLVLFCFLQQENNLDPVCKQIWAGSACAGPRIWRAGKWYAEKLELSGSKPAGVEEQSRSSAQLTGSRALSLWCSSSAFRPELASSCTSVLPRQKEVGQRTKPSARGVRPDSCVLPDNYSWFFFCFYFSASLSLDCLDSQNSLSMLTDTKCFVTVWDANFGAESTSLSQPGSSSLCQLVTAS